MLVDPVAIRQISSVSALGDSEATILNNLRQGLPLFKKQAFLAQEFWVSAIEPAVLDNIDELKDLNKNYKDLDPSVLYALFAAINCLAKTNWRNKTTVGLNLASSRGATHLFETTYQHFLETSYCKSNTSPTTTLGNLSSWVSHHLGLQGPEFSHSITCSSGLHALLNGIAWLNAGMSKQFMVGATEAPLTAFTIAQLEGLKIYSKENHPQACKAFDSSKTKNTLVLGEGAVVLALDKQQLASDVKIINIGFATEPIKHHTAISAEGSCFIKSMQMALEGLNISEIDAIITHSPGTLKGDLAEWEALKQVFGNQIPLLTNNKHLLGHTFAPSGLFSVQMAYLMLKHQEVFPVDYLDIVAEKRKLQKIMVNAVGFGGNAVSVVLGV